MDLKLQLSKQINNSALDYAERVRLRCALAKELEESGDYEAARRAMDPLWQRVGERPTVDGLDQYTTAEVLLRAGSLSGWIGSTRQIRGAQETAKNLISESFEVFESLEEKEKAAEALTDLAYCYWREGAFDEARVMLHDALLRFGDTDSEQKAVALLRNAIVEFSATRFNDALRILTEAAPLFEASSNHSIKGRFHMELAIVLRNLGTAEHRKDYIDRALVEHTAASFHLEKAGHTRYLASVENNQGFLLLTIGRFSEAHEYLNRARGLFKSLKEQGSIAQVDETRAQALLAEGRITEAEKVVRSSVHVLEKGDEQSLLTEALVTHGTALARLGRHAQAHFTFERAVKVAHQGGDTEGAGRAELASIEELASHMSAAEMRSAYERVDSLLANSQHPGILARLRKCARQVIAANQLSHATEHSKHKAQPQQIGIAQGRAREINLPPEVRQLRKNETLNEFINRATVVLINTVRAQIGDRVEAARRLGLAPSTVDQRLQRARARRARRTMDDTQGSVILPEEICEMCDEENLKKYLARAAVLAITTVQDRAGSKSAAARRLGLATASVRHRLQRARLAASINHTLQQKKA